MRSVNRNLLGSLTIVSVSRQVSAVTTKSLPQRQVWVKPRSGPMVGQPGQEAWPMAGSKTALPRSRFRAREGHRLPGQGPSCERRPCGGLRSDRQVERCGFFKAGPATGCPATGRAASAGPTVDHDQVVRSSGAGSLGLNRRPALGARSGAVLRALSLRLNAI